MNPPAIEPDRLDPLAMPGVRRLLLSESASRYLQESGEQCFQILAKCSYPATPGRWAIYLAPVPMATAAAACRVIAGSHRATPIRPPKATAPAPPAITPDRRPDAAQANVSATTAPTAPPAGPQ